MLLQAAVFTEHQGDGKESQGEAKLYKHTGKDRLQVGIVKLC
jgi:hypothetical protein